MSSARSGLILVGAGSSERMGGVDKVWAEIAGKPLFMHSVDRFLSHVAVLVLVLRSDRFARAQALLAGAPSVCVVAGGSTRQESVWNGIQALPDVDLIAVHDVARPLASARLLHEGTRIVTTTDAAGAVPAIAVADTIKRVSAGGVVQRTVDRTQLRAVQTPQVFRAPNLVRAHGAARRAGEPATDDAMLLEERGDRVVTFAGLPENFKVTTPLDLHMAGLLLTRGGAA